ncbi:hypothetical protein RHSIM_Rhsim05G0011200 [Rhododendron simsii]|uniref:Agglutinin domain-containing protein n=1 Tax=Rhododendron simsii TaxID=118357 RepID=A0A834H7G3_RHOSS|nr:hypothetical protein RHSIM_Rhsim05G0011200 [Rhododendron simsii]
MALALALPRFAAIQSRSQTYLRHVNEDGELHGFLEFSGEEIVSPYTKFQIETAKSTAAGNGDHGFVHIRCCYNNKCLVAKSISGDSYIIAGADEPNEDQSQSSCTLFEPIQIDGEGGTGSSSSSTTTTAARFRHVQLGRYLLYPIMSFGVKYRACLVAGLSYTNPEGYDIFDIMDWESLLILPKHVAFKGDNDGNVRIKNNHFGKFWRRSPNWIWADSNDTTNNNSDTLFSPVKVGDNIVALRNLGNNNFCKRLTADGKTNCLNAAISTISKETRMVVEELVISREIYNVNFRTLDATHARIYNQNIILLATQPATNTTQETHTSTLNLTYTDTKSRTWNGSVSLKLGVEISIESGIPLIEEGKIVVTTEFTGSYEWGETVSTENQVESDYMVPVPPMTKVTVSLLATQGSCDVPFSYTQRDTLMNGEQVIQNLDDGVYTGINCFNFYYDTKEEKL